MLPPGWRKTRAETQSKTALIIPEPTAGRRSRGQRESGCAVIWGHPSSSHERSGESRLPRRQLRQPGGLLCAVLSYN